MVIGRALEALQQLASGVRADGWVNTFTGLGTSTHDRASGAAFIPDNWLDTQTLASLYHFNDICRTIVSVFPDDALREPWEWKGPDALELTAWAKRVDLRRKLRRGAKAGRLFGGAIGVMWIDDGRAPEQPVDRAPGAIKGIRDLTIYDRRSVMRVQRFDAPGDLAYAHARVFEVYPPYGGVFRVHRDRCLVFGGVETMDYEREQLAGWDASALQAPYDVIASYESGYLSLSNLLTDASQPVITMKGLIDALSKPDGEKTVTARAQIMNLTRSIARALYLDADAQEKFERVNVQFAGIPDAIDRLGSRLSVATRIPPMKLLGQAPAGLNATGDGEIRNWYDEVAAYRAEEIAPHVDYVTELLAHGRGNAVEWPSLWSPTAKEEAETRAAIATADAAYLDREVVTPEEVALTRRGPLDVRIDPALRRRLPPPGGSAGPTDDARPDRPRNGGARE